ncbi:MAG TPA: hypothetical protein VM779_05365 [Thermoanaerobaculia bacterium]|nr:hypothetical protein [Thermoanaerobaculia bacterium]
MALIAGLLDTYEATFELSLIDSAIELQELADRTRFAAIPAPVAQLAPPVEKQLEEKNLVRLAAITGGEGWKARAGARDHRQVIVSGAPDRAETRALLRAARGRSGVMSSMRRPIACAAAWQAGCRTRGMWWTPRRIRLRPSVRTGRAGPRRRIRRN